MKPLIYIASPYTKGDPALNTRFQCMIFNDILAIGSATPYAPLLSHFQHIMFPQSYEIWLEYDFEIINRCDACLRLDVNLPEYGYFENRSKGANKEARYFEKQGKPVFYNLENMYKWIKVIK